MKSRDLYLRLLNYVLPHKWIFLLSLLATVIYAATEPAMPALIKPLLDGTFVEKDPGGALLFPLLLVGLFVVRGLASFISEVSMKWVANHVVLSLREEMFRKILSLPVRYFDDHSSGNTLSRLTYDVQRVMEAATTVIVTLIKDSLIIIGLLAWSFYISWKLSLVAFLIVPPIAIIIRLVSLRMRTLNRSLQNTMGDLTRVIQEAITGSRVVKVFRGEEYEQKRFDELNDRVRRTNLKIVTTSEANVPIVQLFTVIALAIVVYVASMQSRAGSLSVGEFVSLIGALALISSPLKRLTRINTLLQSGLAAAESVFSLIDEASEPDEGGIAIDHARGEVEFRDLSFTHQGGQKEVLQGINLKVAAGESVALVGPSGSGKTSLVNLLPRFYRPDTGQILLDGADISTLKLSALRNHIAYVDQQIVLFNDTVAANIAYGSHNRASDEQIRAAATGAQAIEFIEELPKGMDTLIGENGVRLSGGQRQRIAIARALLKDAPILIMDEATSSLDSRSERKVQQAIESLRRGRTSLIIAHRLSTIEHADRIVVMKDGRIVEEGDHHSLLKRGGEYALLHRAQRVEVSREEVSQ
mgnify:CR=1 FL=1